MHQIWYTKYTTCSWRMSNVRWSRQPVQDVWPTYTAYSTCLPCIPYESSECMHQIWSTKFTTCTWRMAIVKWSIRRVQDVWLTYTAYSQCSPSIPLCIVGDIWSYVCTKFGTRSIRPVPGVWLTYNEVYNLYRTYGWRTQSIVHVHHVKPIYHRNVCTKFGTRSLRPEPGVWLTYNKVYNVYRTYGWRIQH